jgi:integrase
MASRLPKPVSKEDFDKLLDESKKILNEYWMPRLEKYMPRGKTVKKYIIAIILGFGAGMRISEIVGLDKKYSYSYKGQKRIQECYVPELTADKIENNFIRVIGGKGGKDRQVPLPISLFKKVGITRQEVIDSLPLKVSRGAIQKFTAELGKKVLNKNISFHKLRHGFVTFCLESGMPIHQVQMFAGHSRLDTTGIYLHANPKQALDKYEEIKW